MADLPELVIGLVVSVVHQVIIITGLLGEESDHNGYQLIRVSCHLLQLGVAFNQLGYSVYGRRKETEKVYGSGE